MDERSTNRIGTNEPVQSVSGGRTCTALMYNLSVGGCAVETADEPLTCGAPVTLRVEDLDDIEGTVVWQLGLCAGIAFAQPLHADVVMYLGFKDRAGVTPADFADDRPNFAQASEGAHRLPAEIVVR